VLELFVFFEMGASAERVELLLIAGAPDPADHAAGAAAAAAVLVERFDGFDAANAMCFDPTQRSRLLGIVEAGFGGVTGFNAAIRRILAELRTKQQSDAEANALKVWFPSDLPAEGQHGEAASQPSMPTVWLSTSPSST
jgi:hypothetical protein